MAEADVTRPDLVTIRPEGDPDKDAVRDVVARAFGNPVVAELVDRLREDRSSRVGLDLVAESAGTVVGHLMYSRAWLDAPDRLVKVLVLSPLSVAPEHQGKGVGKALMQWSLPLVEASGYPLVFLEGSPVLYTRFGFRRATRLGFTSPSARIPVPAFQVLTLPTYEDWMSGPVIYPDAFWQLDAVGLRGDDLASVRRSMARRRQQQAGC